MTMMVYPILDDGKGNGRFARRRAVQSMQVPYQWDMIRWNVTQRLRFDNMDVVIRLLDLSDPGGHRMSTQTHRLAVFRKEADIFLDMVLTSGSKTQESKQQFGRNLAN